MESGKPELLEYAHIPAPYVFTATDYVTATINAIVYFFVTCFGTSFVDLIINGHRSLPNVLYEVAWEVGVFGIPLAIAVLQFRNVLRQRKRKAMGRAANKSRETSR